MAGVEKYSEQAHSSNERRGSKKLSRRHSSPPELPKSSHFVPLSDFSKHHIASTGNLEKKVEANLDFLPPRSAEYEYSPLNTNTGVEEFRIIVLNEPSSLGPLSIKLVTVSLADSPPFEAISYCWDTSGPRCRIICQNGSIEQQTQSESRALESITVHSHVKTILQDLQEHTPRSIWLDAICINQHDLQERAKQVRIMDSIYSRASRVVVWLAHPGRKESAKIDQAMQYIRQLGKI